VNFACEDKFTFTRQDLNQGFLGGGVLGQFLTFAEPKQHDAGSGRAQQRAADDAIWRELRFFCERHHTGIPGINKRSFIHDRKLAVGDGWRFDASQRLRFSPLAPPEKYTISVRPIRNKV